MPVPLALLRLASSWSKKKGSQSIGRCRCGSTYARAQSCSLQRTMQATSYEHVVAALESTRRVPPLLDTAACAARGCADGDTVPDCAMRFGVHRPTTGFQAVLKWGLAGVRSMHPGELVWLLWMAKGQTVRGTCRATTSGPTSSAATISTQSIGSISTGLLATARCTLVADWCADGLLCE